MCHQFQGRCTGLRFVPDHLFYQVYCISRSLFSKDACEGQGSDVWEFLIILTRVHLLYLIFVRTSKYFDNFNNLVHTWISREYWVTKQHFCKHASEWPYVDFQRIFSCTEYQFRCSLIPWTNLANITFAFGEYFCTTKVTYFNNVRIINQEILRFDIPVANVFLM